MRRDRVDEATFTDLQLFRKLLQLARPYWLHIPGIFVANLLATPLALLTPVPLAIAIDSVLLEEPLPSFIQPLFPAWATQSETALLLATALLLVAVTVLSQVQAVGSHFFTTYTSERMLLDLRGMLFEHTQRLSMAYHDTKGSSDAIYRIQYDTSYIQSVAIGSVTAIITSAATLVAMVYVLFRLDWKLALIALVVTPPLVLASQSFRQRLRGRYRGVKQLESSALGIVQEVLTSIRVVKAFSQEQREQDRFVERSREGMRERLRLQLLEGGLGIVLGLITAGGTALFLYLGVRRVQAGGLTLGQLTIAMTYLSQLYTPLKSLSKQTAALQGSLASAERTFELLEEAPDVEEREDARPLRRAVGHVEFRDVSFSYDGQTPVLCDVSFQIEAGTRVGIVGRTGAGKSTLTKLLMRLYDPTDGQILLDGVDLRDYRVRDLRQQFAVVLQESLLFSTTVAENIAYGRPDASHADIVAAAKAANAHDFIEAIPGGYDALVGERGMTLSGGQRQRIALARAFLKDAPILVLDEPTSSVDVETEQLIVDATERLREGRTVLTIAHRLSTLDDCEQLLEVSHGQVRTKQPTGGAGRG